MKRLMLLLALCSLANAQIMPSSRRAAATLPASSASYVLKDSNATWSTIAQFSIGFSAGQKFRGGVFVAGSNYTLRKASFYMRRIGTAAYTLTAYVYSDGGSDIPVTLLGTSSNTIVLSTLGATGADKWEEFLFDGVSLASGTRYHFVISISNSTDGSNYAQWRTDSDDTGLGFSASADGSSWVESNADDSTLFKSYSLE